MSEKTEKKISLTVTRAFAIGSEMQDIGAIVRVSEEHASQLIACGKARPTEVKTAGGDNAK